RGVVNAMTRAGASRVSLIDEGVAAGVGCGILSQDARARLMVDIGGGTTNISIVSGAGVITSHSLSIAGIAMDHAIADFIRHEHRVLVGEQTAEQIKKGIGAAYPTKDERTYPAIAKSMSDGSPQEIEIHADELVYALDKTLKTIINSVRLVIEESAPEVASDLYRTGITLAGGGSLLRELDVRFRHEFRLPVMRAERPLEAVALGAGKLLDMPAMSERFETREDMPTWELESAVDYTLAGQASDTR
ncbi:MAG: rod shape-determining protein, partial [Acidobacteria bacterium]|nr:rod shape-determining protein [Acidobacteriota bacterium]